MSLPKKGHIQPTEIADPLKLYYMPVTGWFYQKRLKMALNYFPETPCTHLLEIGFGSGIFLKELKAHCESLYGIDTHDKIGAARNMLKLEDVEAEIGQASAADIPYATDFFDGIVCVSVLEHVTDLDQAMKEIKRVLNKSGTLILGFPVDNVITDFLLRIGYKFLPKEASLEEEHVNTHNDIIKAIKNHFMIVSEKTFPPVLPLNFSLFYVCKCTNP